MKSIYWNLKISNTNSSRSRLNVGVDVATKWWPQTSLSEFSALRKARTQRTEGIRRFLWWLKAHKKLERIQSWFFLSSFSPVSVDERDKHSVRWTAHRFSAHLYRKTSGIEAHNVTLSRTRRRQMQPIVCTACMYMCPSVWIFVSTPQKCSP